MFERMKTFFANGVKVRMTEDDYRSYLKAEYPQEYKAKYENKVCCPASLWGMR